MLKKSCPESGRRATSGVFPGCAGAARQTWGRRFAAFGLTDLPLFAAFPLTYEAYAPRVKTATMPKRSQRMPLVAFFLEKYSYEIKNALFFGPKRTSIILNE